MQTTQRTRVIFTLIAIYLLIKIVISFTAIPPVVLYGLQALLRGTLVTGLLGILAYATYMVIKRRENVWIVFFVIWSVICFFIVPVATRMMIDYGQAAWAELHPQKPVAVSSADITMLHNKQELESLLATSIHPVAVKVSASWCGPCQAMKPHYEKLAAELGNKITFAELDIDAFANKEILAVKGLPTIICYKNSKETFRIAGYRDKMALRQELTKLAQ